MAAVEPVECKNDGHERRNSCVCMADVYVNWNADLSRKTIKNKFRITIKSNSLHFLFIACKTTTILNNSKQAFIFLLPALQRSCLTLHFVCLNVCMNEGIFHLTAKPLPIGTVVSAFGDLGNTCTQM